MTLEKKLINANILVAILIILTPILAYHRYVFPYIYLKNISFRALVLLGLFLMIWYMLQKAEINIRRHYLFVAFAIFVLVQLLASLFGTNISNSFFGNYERMEGWIHYFFLASYFLLLINNFKNTKDWLWIFRFSLFASVWIIFYELFGKWGWVQDVPIRPNAGTLGNSSFFGAYLMFNIFFAAIALYIDKLEKWRIAYLAILLLNIFMLFQNASRSSILGFLAGLFIFMVLWGWRSNKKIKILFAGIFIILLSFSALILSQKNSAWVQNTLFLKRFTDISSTDFSTANRLLIWQVALEAFQDEPVLGYGPDNAIYGLNKYYNPQISEQWFDRVHNFVLDHLLASGIIGLASFLLIFIFAFRASFRYLKQHYFLAVIFISLLSAYLVNSLFTFDSLATWLPLILILAFIDFVAAQGKEGKVITLPKNLFKNRNYILLFIFVFFIVASYFMITKPTKANTTTIKAAAGILADTEASLDYYRQAFGYNSVLGRIDIATALAGNTKSIIALEDKGADIKQAYMDEAEKQISAILEADPKNIRMKMVLADLYLDFADYNNKYPQKAIDLIEPAIADSPDRLEVYAILARGYLDYRNLDKAVEYLEKSLELYDGRQQDYINILSILYNKRDYQKFDYYAEKYLARFDNIEKEYQNNIIGYYLNLGMAKELLDRGFVQRFMTSDPENLSLKLSLMDVYYKADLVAEAEAYIKEVAGYNQEWADELNRYLNVLKEE